jgi:ABC-type multidrug transport system ATPase subunit
VWENARIAVETGLGFSLRAWLSAAEKRRVADAVDEVLTMANLTSQSERLVGELSHGDQRAAEIAMALALKPSLLLLDEPTVGLDIKARADILAHVRGLVAQEGVCVLWATHLVDEIAETDDLIVLHRGQMLAHGAVPAVLAQTGEQSVRAAFTRLTASPDAQAGDAP